MPQHHQGVRFTRSLRRVTVAAIRKTENELGVTFPDDYRAFLRVVNGGIPTPFEFAMAKPSRPGERLRVAFFYGVAATRRQDDLQREQQEIIDRTDTLPKGLVTIGYDPGGHPYFIDTSGKRAGGVYFHDSNGFFDPNGLPKLYLAAKSFSDLLTRLSAGDHQPSETAKRR